MKYSDEKKFIINELGHFSLFDVLVGFEYPTLFVCKDVFSAYYLFYESDYDTDMNEWLIIKITNNQYWDLKTSKISLQQTFENSLEKKWCVFREIGDEQHLQYLTNYPIEYFPFKKDIFVGKPVNIEENYLIKESHEKEQPLLDYKFNLPNFSDSVSIEPHILEKYCTANRLLFKDYGVPESSMRVSLESGSTIIRFSFAHENLFSSDVINNSFYEINKALSSKNAEGIVGAFKGDKSKIKRFLELIETVRTTKIDVSIVGASTSKESYIYKVIDKSIIEEYKKNIDNIAIEEDPILVKMQGYVYSVNTENRKIEFIKDNEKIKADLSEELSQTQLRVNETYLLEVSQQNNVFLNGKLKDVKYKVVNIFSVSKS